MGRACHKLLEILNSVPFQTCLYMVFVLLFQNLSGTVRMPEEYYMDKHVMDRLVENPFDAAHNTFRTIRRVADIYEWGNNVLWPGLYGDLGPCDPAGVVGSRQTSKSCVDDAWPDGEGSFHLDGATPYSVAELVKRMDVFDWTEGLVIRQARAAAQQCNDTEQLGACYPELTQGRGGTAAFGRNYTHPAEPPTHPWEHFTAEQLGANPDGITSPAIPSLRTYDADGFVAVVLPFFSSQFLPEEHGSASEVRDYRETYVTPSNGREARYYCVRLSPNGRHIRQLCDPGTNGDGSGEMTGAVRLATEEMWNDLKRGHFLDAQTRVLTLSLQLRSNHQGVGYRLTLMLELTALGAIIPSYEVETRILHRRQQSRMYALADVLLAMVVVFVLLEGIELFSCGAWSYFSDLWNVMDWANFIVYAMLWVQIQGVKTATTERSICTSQLCSEIGFFDDWKLMATFRDAKMLLSLCICIQFLKILKFASALVPKIGLATSVLKKCMIDLLFFGVAFMISVFAFSSMLSVQLGPVMPNYMDQMPAFISLFRALFGDFDIDEIMSNSSGYLNAILFLAYLFIAIFIMLSMFLAILAEAQIAVREDEAELRSKQEASGDDWDEYGIFSMALQFGKRRVVSPLKRALAREEATSPHLPASPPAPFTTAAAPSAREDELLSAVRALQEEMKALRELHTSKPLEPYHPYGVKRPVPVRPRGFSPLGFEPVSPASRRDANRGRTPSPVRKDREAALNWALQASLKLQA